MTCITRLILSLVLLAAVSSCKYIGTPPSIRTEPPPGPPEYQQGYRDGCDTGMAAYGSQFNKLFHKAKQDPLLAQNPVYYQAWMDAFNYCRGAIMGVGGRAYGNRGNVWE